MLVSRDHDSVIGNNRNAFPADIQETQPGKLGTRDDQ